MVQNLKKVEIRAVGTNDFNLNDDNLSVSGYVNQTGTKSDLLYDWIDDTEFYEVIQPGVFQDAINDANFIDFYYEHDPEKYLASTKDGSLNVEEDDVGLKMNANIVNTTWGQDAYAMIKSGAIAGMSFGFIVTGENWDTSGDVPIRTITGIQLFEVSAVRFPAYPASDIQARNKQRNKLNKQLEARGMELNKVQIPNKKEVRDDMADSGVTSSDINNLVGAINDLQKSTDNQTDCISSSFTSLLNALTGDDETNSKKSKPSEKRDDDEDENTETDSNKNKRDDDSDDEKDDSESDSRSKEDKRSKEKRSNALNQLEELKNMIK